MTIMESHHLAMDLADRADQARRRGEDEAATNLLTQAFQHEREAAMKVVDRKSIEPTRSVLFRSAASLGLEAGLLREAEKMVAYALSGAPPDEIAEELRDLLEKISFDRHLSLRGLKLAPNEMQLSIWGPAIGLGVVQSREFRERIEMMETLSFRTLERKLERPFRSSGPLPKEVAEFFDVYVSAPRAASFAITIQLACDQQSFPGLDLGADVVGEIVENLDLLNARRTDELRGRIPDTTYFENFVNLARQLAPDGKRVSYVGLTTQIEDQVRKVRLDRTKKDMGLGRPPSTHDQDETIDVRITGMLRFADVTKKRHGRIEIVDENNAIHKIKVPLSMMADIVRPMFDYEVEVIGKRDDRGLISMEDISRVEGG